MIERFAQLPSALQATARWARIGPSGIPAMLVHPAWDEATLVPVLIWMHGRTAHKELDPGRYLRLMRAGIGVCAVDLPGHGERFDAAYQDPRHTLEVILQMIDEIDEVVDGISGAGPFDGARMAVGGMSAGGMATMARLCHEHPFVCAAVEAASGSWEDQQHREMFRECETCEIARDNPLDNLDGWREIPFQAIHTRADQWVGYDGQAKFVDALRAQYADPEQIEFVSFDETGAPFEHAGFGRMSADAKDKQRDFLVRHLL